MAHREAQVAAHVETVEQFFEGQPDFRATPRQPGAEFLRWNEF